MPEASSYECAAEIRSAIITAAGEIDDALQLLAETQPGRRERLRLAMLGNAELMDRLLKTTAGNDPFGTNRERGAYCGLAIDAFVDGLLAVWRDDEGGKPGHSDPDMAPNERG